MTHDKLRIWLYSFYSTGTEDITVAQINGLSIHQAKWLAIRMKTAKISLVPFDDIHV